MSRPLVTARPDGGRRHRDDRGSALVITLMAMVLIGALATTIAVVATRDLSSSSLAQSAGQAVDGADAGVAEGISYLRANGIAAVQACPTPTTDDPWATGFTAFDLGSQTCVSGLADSHAKPVTGQAYSVLIAARTDYAAGTDGAFQIVGRGTGPGRAARVVTAGVRVSGIGLPSSVVQGNVVSLVGNVTLRNQSIFSTGCVWKRSHVTLSGTDAFGLPAAVHAEGTITDSNGSAHDCPGVNKAIHPPACSSSYPFDQDALGGALGTCAGGPSGAQQKYYPQGSKLAAGDLQRLYGVVDPPLSDEQIANLRAIAQSQGNLRTNTSAFAPHGQNAVLFYDLPGSGGSVDLSGISGFGYQSGCPDRSLVVVIKNGDAIFHSGAPLMASVYVLDKGRTYDANGGGIIGSVYADTLAMNGNTVIADQAQGCANKHPSPATLQFSLTSYRELDN